MSVSEAKLNRQRVRDALAEFLEADEYGNSYRYFRAGDIAEKDPHLSAAMVGKHLPKIEAKSLLPDGLTIKRRTETQCRATLWVGKKDSELPTTDKQEVNQ
jgi:hypothetical protein